MKKGFTLILTLCMMLALASPVYADVIWEPYGDSFYEEHRGEFRLCEDYYYANSPTGSVYQYDRPGGEKGEAIPNGTAVNICYIYTDGDQEWGLTGEETYLDMSQMLDRYDREFFDDHPEITQEPPAGVTCALPRGTAIYAWTYPGGVPSETETFWDEDTVSGCTRFYTDEDGNVWGYIGYWYGHQDYWVCLTDCHNPDLAQPEIYRGTVYFGENGESTVPEEEDTSLKPLYILLPVAAVVVAVVLLLLWPKRRNP